MTQVSRLPGNFGLGYAFALGILHRGLPGGTGNPEPFGQVILGVILGAEPVDGLGHAGVGVGEEFLGLVVAGLGMCLGWVGRLTAETSVRSLQDAHCTTRLMQCLHTKTLTLHRNPKRDLGKPPSGGGWAWGGRGGPCVRPHSLKGGKHGNEWWWLCNL